MTFIIQRASLWKGNPKVEGAFKAGEDWYIELQTMNDLYDLLEREGTLILSPKRTTKKLMPSIQIYDAFGEEP